MASSRLGTKVSAFQILPPLFASLPWSSAITPRPKTCGSSWPVSVVAATLVPPPITRGNSPLFILFFFAPRAHRVGGGRSVPGRKLACTDATARHFLRSLAFHITRSAAFHTRERTFRKPSPLRAANGNGYFSTRSPPRSSCRWEHQLEGKPLPHIHTSTVTGSLTSPTGLCRVSWSLPAQVTTTNLFARLACGTPESTILPSTS